VAAKTMNTSALITAICTTCGGKLTVDTKRNVATCPYCGNTFLIATCVQNGCEPTVDNSSINSEGVGNKYKVTQPDDVICRIKLAPAWFSTEDTLELTGKELVILAGDYISRVFKLYRIYDLDFSDSQMTFSYLPKGLRYSFDLDKDDLSNQRLSVKGFVRMIEGLIDLFP
jgi:predicted RNA-binding Zn-ribbon protein involved in translation (DUF1610 family)